MKTNKLVNKAVIYQAPHEIAIGGVDTPEPQNGEALIRMLYSGISRGTERLVYKGLTPESEYQSMRAPLQVGDFPFPVRYGYAAVGEVVAAPGDACAALIGRRVFVLHPHQMLFTAPCEMLIAVPDAVPSRRATLAPNLETALNACWDAGVGPGDRVAVVGVGGVGALLATLLSRIPGIDLSLIDPQADRIAFAEAIGARFFTPDATPPLEADIVFHASATEAGLQTALQAAGMEAAVIELSWYGEKSPRAPLGRGFHSKRLRLISSQVGQVAPSRRPRWSYARRLAKAVEMLGDDRYQLLLGEDAAFADVPERAADWFGDGPTPLGAVTLRYPDAY